MRSGSDAEDLAKCVIQIHRNRRLVRACQLTTRCEFVVVLVRTPVEVARCQNLTISGFLVRATEA